MSRFFFFICWERGWTRKKKKKMDIHLQNTQPRTHTDCKTCTHTHTTISTNDHDVSIGKGRNENALLWWCWSEKPCFVIKNKAFSNLIWGLLIHSPSPSICPFTPPPIHPSLIHLSTHPAITLVYSHHLKQRPPTQLNPYYQWDENTTDPLLRGNLTTLPTKKYLCHLTTPKYRE